MPKNAVDYSKTIIYKIVCKDLSVTDCYVGHTTDFRKRKWNHKSNSNNKNYLSFNFKIYQFIRENGGWDNWDMIEIENYPCEDGNKARARERFWYEELKAKLNTDIPNHSKVEWALKTKEIMTKYYKVKNKEWYDKNKEEKNQKCKSHYENNKEKYRLKRNSKWTCDCGSITNYGQKSTHFKTIKPKKYLDMSNSNDVQETTPESFVR